MLLMKESLLNLIEIITQLFVFTFRLPANTNSLL